MIEKPTLQYEKALWEQGFFYIAGIDEAGRGAWAGPVTAGAAILPVEDHLLNLLDGVRDSKQMTAAEREQMAQVITANAVCWAVGAADNLEIDRIGILPATRLAMERAIEGLSVHPDFLLTDYVFLPRVMLPQKPLPKGDVHSLSIASASVLAKVTRDRWMSEVAAVNFPQYGFEKHKGYGTQLHQDSLATYGPCAIHRQSFKPVGGELRLF